MAEQSAESAWRLSEFAPGEKSAGCMQQNLGQSRLKRQTGQGLSHPNRYFVPAGQSTQMIVGATQETDYQIISVTEALYERFEMKRVFYSAFVNVNQDESLPALAQGPPLLREHRLYQADFLLRFYEIGRAHV